MTMRVAAAFLLGALMLLCGVSRAATADGEVIVLHGTNDGEGIDPAIPDRDRGKLRRPPYSSYKHYRLLSRRDISLDSDKAAAVLDLPERSTLTIRLVDVEAGGRRCVLESHLDTTAGRRVIPRIVVKVRPGEIFFIGGQEYKGGILVIGIRLKRCRA